MSQVLVSDTLHEWRQTAAYWTKHHDTIRTMSAPLTHALMKQAHIVAGNPYWTLPAVQVLSRHVAASPIDPDAPDAFRSAEPGKLAAILEQAGAIDIRECGLNLIWLHRYHPNSFRIFVLRSRKSCARS